MSERSHIFKRLFRLLAARELTLILFLLLCALLVPRTFMEAEDISLGWPGRVLFGAMGLNLAFCTLQRIKSLSQPVIVMHAGTLLVLAGTVISSFGFVATVNIYEGTSVNTAYRWDLKRDEPLGFDLLVKSVDIDYYPIPVRIGIMRGEEKYRLEELRTGEGFALDGYTVRADSLELPAAVLKLNVFRGGEHVGSADTDGMKTLPPDFPFGFVLVAYQNPRFSRVQANLVISRNGDLLAEGPTEVNAPLQWNKNSFYNTNIEYDKFGIRFAGLQITNDPGKPYVYAGFAVIGAGSVLYLIRRVTRRRPLQRGT